MKIEPRHEKRFADQFEAQEYADQLELETGKDYVLGYVNHPQDTTKNYWIVEETENE